MKFTVEFNRREVCRCIKVVEAETREDAEALAEAILEEGDLDWDVVEVGDEWVDSITAGE